MMTQFFIAPHIYRATGLPEGYDDIPVGEPVAAIRVSVRADLLFRKVVVSRDPIDAKWGSASMDFFVNGKKASTGFASFGPGARFALEGWSFDRVVPASLADACEQGAKDVLREMLQAQLSNIQACLDSMDCPSDKPDESSAHHREKAQ